MEDTDQSQKKSRQVTSVIRPIGSNEWIYSTEVEWRQDSQSRIEEQQEGKSGEESSLDFFLVLYQSIVSDMKKSKSGDHTYIN